MGCYNFLNTSLNLQRYSQFKEYKDFFLSYYRRFQLVMKRFSDLISLNSLMCKTFSNFEQDYESTMGVKSQIENIKHYFSKFKNIQMERTTFCECACADALEGFCTVSVYITEPKIYYSFAREFFDLLERMWRFNVESEPASPTVQSSFLALKYNLVLTTIGLAEEKEGNINNSSFLSDLIDLSSNIKLWYQVVYLRSVLAIYSSKCAHCLQKDTKLKCSRCPFARYCTADCQRKHWKYHKLICGKYSPLEFLEKFIYAGVPWKEVYIDVPEGKS